MTFGIAPKDIRRILYVKKISGVLSQIKSKKISGNVTQIRVGKKTFNFDIGNPLFRRRNKFFYFVDVDRGQLSLNENIEQVSPEIMDAILSENVVKQIVGSLRQATIESWFMIVIYIGLGVAVGYIIGNAVPIG